MIEACRALLRHGQPVQLGLTSSIIDAAYGELISTSIKTHGLQQCVHLRGTLSSTMVRHELCTANVCAMASLETNSPMGVEEAMAVGLPLITSKLVGTPYVIRPDASALRGILMIPMTS